MRAKFLPTPAFQARSVAAATVVGVAVAVFAFAYDRGGYAVESRNLVAALVWSAILFGLAAGVWRGRRPPVVAIVAGAFLTSLAAFAAISAAWAPSTERALDDSSRTLLYAGVFVLVLLASGPSRRERWLDGLALAITAVVAVALVSRLFPGVFGAGAVLRLRSEAVWRLSFPLGYWNGLAVFAAMGVPLLLRAALGRWHPVLRGVALLPLPGFAALIYLTASRGGTLAAVVAVFAFFVVVPRRAATLVALAVATPAAVAAVMVVRERSALVDGPFETALAREQGHTAALWIALACLACGLVYAGVVAVGSRVTVGKRVEQAVLAAGVVAVIAAVVAAQPLRRFDDFRQLPTREASESTESHLLSSSGTGRWQLWEAAVDQFETRPAVGRGAGSYEMWQTQHGSLGLFVQDAHSLYLQTLGELGIVGLLLLAGALAAGFAAGLTALRRPEDDDRLTVAALLAVLASFCVACAFDWIWHLPAVAVVGIIALALITAGGTGSSVGAKPRSGARRRLADMRIWGATLAAVAVAAIVAESLPLLSQLQVNASRTHAADGDLSSAMRDAVRARALTPWNASPYVQAALVAERGENYTAARAWIDEATRRDRSDWRLWLTAARIQTESGRIAEARRSLARARILNPRLPLVPVEG